jgi:tetratricopeptide (TPR) repeat protein
MKSAEIMRKIAGIYKTQPDAEAKITSYFDRVILEYGDDQKAKAAALRVMGDIVRGDAALGSKAAEYYSRESEAWRLAGNHGEAANALIRTVQADAGARDKSKLVEMLDQALVDYTAIAGDDLKQRRTSVLSDLILLANAYSERGVKTSALKALNLALVMGRPADGEFATPDYRVNEIIQSGSKILLELRDEQEADNFFKNVFAYDRAYKDSISGAPELEGAASYYARANNPTKAIDYYKQAFEIYHKQNIYLQFDVIRKLGTVYQTVGPKAPAEYFAQVLPLFSSNSDRAAALSAIGQFYNETKDLPQAISYYEKALEAARPVPNLVNTQTSILRTLSTLYRNLGQKERADDLMRQADALLRPTR